MKRLWSVGGGKSNWVFIFLLCFIPNYSVFGSLFYYCFSISWNIQKLFPLSTFMFSGMILFFFSFFHFSFRSKLFPRRSVKQHRHTDRDYGWLTTYQLLRFTPMFLTLAWHRHIHWICLTLATDFENKIKCSAWNGVDLR